MHEQPFTLCQWVWERKKSIMYELQIMHEKQFTLCQHVWEEEKKINHVWTPNHALTAIYLSTLCEHIWGGKKRKKSSIRTHTYTHARTHTHTHTHTHAHTIANMDATPSPHPHTNKKLPPVEFALTCSLGWSCFPHWRGGQGQSAPGPECGPPGRTGVGLDARLTCCTRPTGLAENQTTTAVMEQCNSLH